MTKADQAWWDKAFLAALPTAMSQNWSTGNERHSTPDGKAFVAGLIADAAVAERRKRTDADAG